jgi:hypothetical protein
MRVESVAAFVGLVGRNRGVDELSSNLDLRLAEVIGFLRHGRTGLDVEIPHGELTSSGTFCKAIREDGMGKEVV